MIYKLNLNHQCEFKGIPPPFGFIQNLKWEVAIETISNMLESAKDLATPKFLLLHICNYYYKIQHVHELRVKNF